MKTRIVAMALMAALGASAAMAQAAGPAAKKAAAHVILTSGDLKGGPAPLRHVRGRNG